MEMDELVQDLKQDAIDILDDFYQPSYVVMEEELAPGCYLYRLVRNREKDQRIEKRLKAKEDVSFFERLSHFLKRPFTSGSR